MLAQDETADRLEVEIPAQQVADPGLSVGQRNRFVGQDADGLVAESPDEFFRLFRGSLRRRRYGRHGCKEEEQPEREQPSQSHPDPNSPTGRRGAACRRAAAFQRTWHRTETISWKSARVERESVTSIS